MNTTNNTNNTNNTNKTNKTLAFVFPGQGSQSLGMLANYAETPIIQQTFKEASLVLGYDLWQLIQAGPAEKLNQTQYTQPALLTAGVALWRLWLASISAESEKSFMPSVLAGHSLGEYTALVCAKSLNFQETVALVALRGQLMQEAVPAGTGAMAAILGLDNETVASLCLQAQTELNTKSDTETEIVSPANYNAIGQVVIAGHLNAVVKAMEIAKSRGGRVVRLPVSVPSHCNLMKSASLKLDQALKKIEIQLPILPVIHNVDVSEHQSVDNIRQALVEQLYRPVRWVEIIQKMATQGVTTIVECGPGAVLSGLNKRINSELRSVTFSEFLDKAKIVI